MSEVDDWLLHKLFADEAEKKLTDPQFTSFLHEISNFRAAQLSNEPQRLAEEKLGLQEETETLAFSNYKTFIQAANCSKEIYDDFTLINEHLEGVVSHLPDLGTQCRSFLQEAQKISGRRAANSLALNKYSHVLEILEIPQVMDTCVRAEYWEEALELAQHVGKLNRRLGHIPIIKKITLEVESQRQQLLEQLVEQLHSHLSLPQCLKVVGYLRRLGVFTEAELRIKFLSARDRWFRTRLAEIPGDDAYQHITKVMEQSRVHLFDIITQYRAVFADDDPLSIVSGAIPISTPFGRPLAQREELPTNLSAIFNSWLSHKVDEFLETLELDLAKGVEGRMDSVLAQCMYFGLSFGRVGADFRSLACPLFESAAFVEFSHNLERGTAKILHDLQDDAFLDEIQQTASADLSGGLKGESLSPSVKLLDWNRLALYCNAILTGFNNLRLCLPLTLAERVTKSIEASLESIVHQLSAIAETHHSAWNSERKAKFVSACRLLVEQLIPHLNACLAALFPAASLSALLGLSSIEFSQKKTYGRIDPELCEPIRKYLPAPPTIINPPIEDEEERPSAQEVEETQKTDDTTLEEKTQVSEHSEETPEDEPQTLE